MKHDYRQIWECYAKSWQVGSQEEKLQLFEQSLDLTCQYTDPLVQTTGWQQLLDYMVEFHRQVPGGHFETQWFLAHHGRSIAQWHMYNEKKQRLGEGISYGTYNDQGKLLSMTGFFETP